MQLHALIQVRGLAMLLAGGLLWGLPATAEALGPKSAQPPVAPEGASAKRSDEVLAKVGITQKLGEGVPLDLELVDSSGEPRTLGDLLGRRPVVLAMVYYECPMLCTMVLNGMLRMLNVLKFDAGHEFEVITVSIDPRETPELAAQKKKKYLDRYRRPGAEKGWHFLVGNDTNVDRLADALGYRYAYDETTDQFAHGSAIMVLTPEGKISRYFYGIDYSPVDVRLALVEASDERIGSFTDAILLSCFQYNPLDGKYSFAIMRVIRVAGVVTVLGILSFIAFNYRRDRRKKASVPSVSGS